MDCSTPGFPVHHQLPEFAQTHAHRVRDIIQPSHPLLPLLLLPSIFPSTRGFSSESVPYTQIMFIVVAQSLSHVKLLMTPWTAACQASLSFTISWSLLKLMSIELVMPSKHLILCGPFFSCPQSFPASRSFPMSQLFASGGQSIGVSASTSVLPMNTQD